MALPARRLRALRRARSARARCSTSSTAMRRHERAPCTLMSRRSAAIGAMILAAGRGERMRPLSDATPKPLLEAGGKPLIVWQIEALARAGFRDIVVNVSAPRRIRSSPRLGDGAALGVTLRWSIEAEPLEVAGGIATALPLLPPGPALIVSGDVYTAFDYASVAQRARRRWHATNRAARAHLVLVPNPALSPERRFRARRRARRARAGRALHLREYRALRHRALPRTSARARSSNCCPTSNGG